MKAGCRRTDLTLRAAIQHYCLDPSNDAVDLRRLETHPYLGWQKRLFDLLFGGSLLLAALPLMALIAAAIRLESRGPALFRQERTGRLGRRFRLWKFRTMYDGAEAQKDALKHLNMHGQDSPDFKLRNDPRVTRVGRLLRPLSLDELPNLINVIRGEMSLVGPRPTSFPASVYRPEQVARLALKPGITGLWQVSGRSDLCFEHRCQLDVEYINKASLGYDIKLVLITPFRLMEGAY